MATKTTKTGTKTTTTSKTGAKTPAKKNKNNASGLPLLKAPGDITYDDITAPTIESPDFDFTDTSFDYGQVDAQSVQAGTVTAGNLANQFMTAAEYAMVDPSKIAAEYGDINREQMGKNADLSSELALKYLDTELQGLQNFVPAASALKRGQIAEDNTFNQSERDRQLAAGDPNLRKDLEDQAARARAYASGSVPDSIQDKALEFGIRSGAADAAAGGGFGVRSGAARKASALMSAQERIALSQYGDQALTANMQGRNSMLLAPTQYSDAGAQISVNPTQSGAQIAMGIASEANAGNITASEALGNLTQQEQFKTGLEQDTRKTNVGLAADRDLNQARLNLEADTTNVGNKLTADTFSASSAQQAQTTNANNAVQTQIAGKQISSNEKQSKAQLDWNTSNSNAQRTFEATSINSQNKVDLAKYNQSTKLDIQKTNKAMIFQDQQQKSAQAASAANAAAANAGANARAAMGYAAQKDAQAQALQLQREQMAFQLNQQALATQAYQNGQNKGQGAASSQAAGNIIARAPAVISGASSLIDAGRNIYNSIFTPSKDTSSSSGGYSSVNDMLSGNSGREQIGSNSDGSAIYA